MAGRARNLEVNLRFKFVHLEVNLRFKFVHLSRSKKICGST